MNINKKSPYNFDSKEMKNRQNPQIGHKEGKEETDEQAGCFTASLFIMLFIITLIIVLSIGALFYWVL